MIEQDRNCIAILKQASATRSQAEMLTVQDRVTRRRKRVLVMHHLRLASETPDGNTRRMISDSEIAPSILCHTPSSWHGGA